MTTTPLTDQQLRDHVAEAIAGHWPITPNNDGTVICHCGDRVKASSSVRLEFRQHTAAAVLAVVQPELDRLAARRGLYRAAWMNARNRAAGHQQRYRYERKLCHSADIRAAGAIRAQLAAERKRDDLAAELGRARAELATANAAVAAVTALLPADRAEDTNASWLPPRRVRDALGAPAPHVCVNCEGVDPDTCLTAVSPSA